MRATACCSCSYLKAVIQVRLTPTKQLKQTLQRVHDQKKSAPKFVLRDMHPFMLAQCGLLLRTARNDNVAKSDRRERQSSNCFAQHSTARRKGDFQHTANASKLRPD